MRFLSFALVTFLYLIPLQLSAAEQAENRARLEQIQQRIESASKTLKTKQQQELSLLRDLAVINTSMQEIDRRIKNLRRKKRQGEKQISAAQKEISQSKRELRVQESRLQKRLGALYKEGDTGILKILFSSKSPTELAEQYAFLSRILAHDKEMMDDFRVVLARHNKHLTNLQKLQKEQQKRLDEEKAERQDAKSARQIQAQLLGQVRRNKSQLQSELQQLNEKARRLEDLVNNLKQKGSSGGHFASQKGKLPWPIRGQLLVGFGTQKNQDFGTLYESRGIEVAAAKGATLKAVAPGKVVFARWFKGYGNLLILAHDGGYHTLYAKTDSLLKEIGDLVEAGEPLAKAGLPGEQGIYFEIRQNGSPVNPLSWLSRR